MLRRDRNSRTEARARLSSASSSIRELGFSSKARNSGRSVSFTNSAREALANVCIEVWLAKATTLPSVRNSSPKLAFIKTAASTISRGSTIEANGSEAPPARQVATYASPPLSRARQSRTSTQDLGPMSMSFTGAECLGLGGTPHPIFVCPRAAGEKSSRITTVTNK